MDEMTDMHIVAGSPDAAELAALVAGIQGLVASSAQLCKRVEAESEWQRRARPARKGFGLPPDAWQWAQR